MFKKLLIANRGEIACRIIKTARQLGLRTVAVYSEIDAHALHVAMADEAYCIGPAPSAESYLNIKNIIKAALQTHAEAIHPGYGFLSEDAEFAEQCQQAGLIFIGPTAQAIRVMGDKNLAKETVAAAGVPVAPSFYAEVADITAFKKAAQKIGFPLLVKANAGGGGKGMRLVTAMDELEAAITGAQREAQASFGDARVFLEKYLAYSRHIELQILFDNQGHGVYLFDRDCSIQRRHQKVIEEAPAPGLSDSTRLRMAETALSAGAAINYRGVGTIEFLVDEHENFYFMEMNTRLQVEHGVTEMITGLDLVEWQLRIAAGERLNLVQATLRPHGHAIEARLYAENPQQNFMPSAGTLLYFQLPAEHTGKVRVDTGFRPKDVVSIHYDPLLAKIMVWGKDRPAAINRLQQVLAEIAVVGIHTNLTLLYRIASHPAFSTDKIETRFISDHQKDLLSLPELPQDNIVILAGLALLHRQQRQQQDFQQFNEDVYSPWISRKGWRLNGVALNQLSFYLIQQSEQYYQINIDKIGEDYVFYWHDRSWIVQVSWHDKHRLTATIAEQLFTATTFFDENRLTIFSGGEVWHFSLALPKTEHLSTENNYALRAPMPGTLIALYVKPGQTVKAGERLAAMEAMKMEHTLTAPRDGTIETVFFQPGERVSEGAQLLAFVIDKPVND